MDADADADADAEDIAIALLHQSAGALKMENMSLTPGINYGLLCSGILPSHYVKFCHGGGLGAISCDKRSAFFVKH